MAITGMNHAVLYMRDARRTAAFDADDPDGREFEVMWLAPAEHWGAEEHEAIVHPLDLDGDRARFSSLGVS